MTFCLGGFYLDFAGIFSFGALGFFNLSKKAWFIMLSVLRHEEEESKSLTLLHFNIALTYFSVDFGLRETSAAFNSPGKLHGRSVRWLPGLGLGVGQVRTKNGYDGCDCHSGEVVKEIFPSPHFTVKYCTVNERFSGKRSGPFCPPKQSCPQKQ